MDKVRTVLLAAFATLLLGLVSVLAVKGSYSRYAQDDYCYGYRFRVDNFWEAQVKSYFGATEYNSNRYSLTLFNGLAERNGGPNFAPFMPVILLISWTIVLVYFLFLLLKNRKQLLLWVTAALALVFFTFLVTPNLYQVLFWVSANNTYTTPAILVTLSAARLLHFTLSGRFTKWNMAEVVLLNILAGGFSETLTAWQLTLWVCAFIALFLLDRKGLFQKAKWPLLLAAIGTLVALGIMMVNPTNSHRVSFYGHESLLTGLWRSFSFGLLFIKRSIKLNLFPTAFIILMGLWLGLQARTAEPGNWKKGLFSVVAIFASTFILCAAVMAPSVILTDSYPGDRQLFPASFSLVAGLFAFGWIAGQVILPWLSKLVSLKVVQAALAALAVLLLVYLGSLFPRTAAQMPLFQSRARAWDARQQMILEQKATGQDALTVPAFDSIFGVTELGSDPGNWVNRCAAWYYGVDSITAEDGYLGFGAYSIGK
jgi:hypothetical protein